MITSQAANYAKVLFSLGLSEDSINKSKEILLGSRELALVLENPSIKKKEKEAVIDDIFEKDIRNFLKILCLHQQISCINQIFSEYDRLVLESKNVIRAKLSYVTKPDETELEQIKSMLCNKYKKTGVILELLKDPDLIGGYVLSVANTEYDKSIKGTLKEMQKALVRR